MAASSWIAVTETLSPAKSRATIAMLMNNTLQAARQQSGGAEFSLAKPRGIPYLPPPLLRRHSTNEDLWGKPHAAGLQESPDLIQGGKPQNP